MTSAGRGGSGTRRTGAGADNALRGHPATTAHDADPLKGRSRPRPGDGSDRTRPRGAERGHAANEASSPACPLGSWAPLGRGPSAIRGRVHRSRSRHHRWTRSGGQVTRAAGPRDPRRRRAAARRAGRHEESSTRAARSGFIARGDGDAPIRPRRGVRGLRARRRPTKAWSGGLRDAAPGRHSRRGSLGGLNRSSQRAHHGLSSQQGGQRLSGCSPSQRLAGPTVERAGDGLELVGSV